MNETSENKTIKLYAVLNNKFKVGETYDRDALDNGSGYPNLHPMPLDALENYVPFKDFKNISQYRIVRLSGDLRKDGQKLIIGKRVRIDDELSLNALIEEQLSYFESNRDNDRHYYISDDEVMDHNCCFEYRANDFLPSISAEDRINTINRDEGDNGSIMVSGGSATQVISFESFSTIASNGEKNQLVASNICSIIASSGKDDLLSANAPCSTLISTGDNARLSASADTPTCISSGKNSVISMSGRGGMFMAANGTSISFADYNDNGECVGFVIGRVGENQLKADTWYEVKNGKFVEAV